MQARNSVDFKKLTKFDDLKKPYIDKAQFLSNPGNGKVQHYELDFTEDHVNGKLVLAQEDDVDVIIQSYYDQVAIDRVIERATLGDLTGLNASKPYVNVGEGIDFDPETNVDEVLKKYGITPEAYQQAVKAQSVSEYLDILLKSKEVKEDVKNEE